MRTHNGNLSVIHLRMNAVQAPNVFFLQGSVSQAHVISYFKRFIYLYMCTGVRSRDWSYSELPCGCTQGTELRFSAKAASALTAGSYLQSQSYVVLPNHFESLFFFIVCFTCNTQDGCLEAGTNSLMPENSPLLSDKKLICLSENFHVIGNESQ